MDVVLKMMNSAFNGEFCIEKKETFGEKMREAEIIRDAFSEQK